MLLRNWSYCSITKVMIQCIDIALNFTYHGFHAETSYIQWCDDPSLHKDIPGMEVSYIPHLWGSRWCTQQVCSHVHCQVKLHLSISLIQWLIVWFIFLNSPWHEVSGVWVAWHSQRGCNWCEIYTGTELATRTHTKNSCTAVMYRCHQV